MKPRPRSIGRVQLADGSWHAVYARRRTARGAQALAAKHGGRWTSHRGHLVIDVPPLSCAHARQGVTP